MRQIASLEVPKETIGKQVTLNSIVQDEVCFRSADLFFKHKVATELRLDQAIPPTESGVIELHQAVFILLENAIEALFDVQVRKILLETARKGEQVQLLVESSSGPIGPEQTEQLFEPFFTTKEGHAGLGLYLARKLVQGLGGEITCESEPGRTRFYLRLPVSELRTQLND